MPKRTLYARPVDEEDWAWAQAVAEENRTSLSRIVIDAIRAYRASRDAVGQSEKTP